MWFLIAGLTAVATYVLGASLEPAPRVVASIAALGMVLWVSETLPLEVTALLVSFLLIVLVGFAPATIFAAYFDPVVVLLLGGFVMGVALQKHGLDRYLANALLVRIGGDPKIVLLGLMAVSAGFSMWISNTASTAIILPIALSVLAVNRIGLETTFAKASVLGVAYGATIGGVGTLVGSTPNPLAARFLADAGSPISFADWMFFMVPLMIVLLVVAWVLLLRLYPPDVGAVQPLGAAPRPERAQLLVMAIFFVTVALWLTTGIHGVAASVVSLFPLLAMYGFRLLEADDFRKIDWGTLVLIGGSIALGQAMQASGLDLVFAGALATTLAGQPLALIFLILFLAAVGLTVFASNTAAAVVTIPLVIPLAPILGVSVQSLVFVAAVGVSMDFMVPVGTPPNAMAYATGVVRVRDMLRAGIPLSLTAGLATVAVALLYW